MRTKSPIDGTALASLYAQHCEEKAARFQAILEATGYHEIVIGSGHAKMHFQDDMAYPFKANPYFREWVPLGKRAASYLHIRRGSHKPRLYLLAAEDIWHSAPQTLPDGFEDSLEIIEYASLDGLKKQWVKNAGAIALINETNDLGVEADCWNPQPVLHQIDFQRRSKTQYEQACVRRANQLAAPAHRVAEQRFMAGASELEIAAAYLAVCNCSENHMPYAIIAGINQHAAVLHHHNLNPHRVTPRSFLIDAGVACNGYAADITRTYAYDSGSDFATMIERLDSVQQELVAAGGIGKSPVDLHVLSQHKIAQILIEFKLLKISAEQAVEQGIVGTFYPHGLGHHLGCNVHDKGSRLANAQGELLPASEKYPKLRAGAPMVANQIHTVEPGLYFIPALLDKLRASDQASAINWAEMDRWIPYGGIRIEDNIILHTDGSLENITREAFAQ
ncbi:MAG: Xaa-Pro dipeptidase [Porticoccaceae bacterium]|nr:Xaa-Pro dipeptidase [Porticoccaceae bacterium]